MDMLIDGAWTGAADGKVGEVRNPATGALIDTVPLGTAADALRAVTAAQHGKVAMARLPSHQRCAILMRVADRIEADQDELSKLLCRENGKTRREIVSEL